MNIPVTAMQIFREDDEYFSVEIQADRKIILKRKVYGWGDTWSLPLDVVNI